MKPAEPSIDRDLYLQSLGWRQTEIRGRLEVVRGQIQLLQKEEADLMQEVRAIDLLLGVANNKASPPEGSVAPTAESRTQDGQVLPDFSGWGPTAREIYQCTYKVILDAGVPMHYRALAENVQERVALSGADPGATLIAHLHRAPEIFPRVGRGVYGIASMAPNASAETDEGASGGAPSPRRTRTRRRRIR